MRATPAAVVSLVTRNVVPVVGVWLLGWSAANLLVLYYLDTMLVIVARWWVIVIAGTIGIFGLLGPWLGGTLIVFLYAGATVYFEITPERTLRWLNPKEARADAARDAARPQ